MLSSMASLDFVVNEDNGISRSVVKPQAVIDLTVYIGHYLTYVYSVMRIWLGKTPSVWQCHRPHLSKRPLASAFSCRGARL